MDLARVLDIARRIAEQGSIDHDEAVLPAELLRELRAALGRCDEPLESLAPGFTNDPEGFFEER